MHRNSKNGRSSLKSVVGTMLLVMALLMPLQGLAQVVKSTSDRRLAAGDIVQINVPDRPSMNATLSLDAAGKVPITQVGDVAIGGLTIAEAELVLRQRLRLFDPSLSSVELVLQSNEGGGLNFFLLGEVLRPGEYSFAEVPSYWDLLRTAGGPTGSSNLRQVRLIREANGKTIVTEIDLSGLVEGNGPPPEVEMLPGDTLVIPALLAGVSAVPTETGVKVFGAVEVPTVVDIKGPTPILDVLMLAGAPSAESELKKVYWVHNVGDVPQARVVDLMSYLEAGNPMGNPLVYPGDTIRVEYFRESWVRRNVPFILGSLAAMATIYLAYDNVVND